MSKKIFRITSLFLVIAMIATVFTGCASRHETAVVNAVVTEKNFVDDEYKYCWHYNIIHADYRWGFKYFPSEYNVTLKYNNITQTYNNKSLYNNYEEGDIIEVDFTQYYDEEDKLITDGIYAPSISLR